MPLITWTPVQDATLADLQAAKGAALDSVADDISKVVAASPIDQSFAPIITAFLFNNAQAVFDMLSLHYTPSPVAVDPS